jgi:hypothetical protein
LTFEWFALSSRLHLAQADGVTPVLRPTLAVQRKARNRYLVNTVWALGL